MNKPFLLNDDNWSGGYYELSLEFYPSGSDKRVLTAMKALCEISDFYGPWKEKNHFENDVLLLDKIEEESVTQLYGILKISEHHAVSCLVSITRITNESDWLSISIPMSTIEKFYPVKYDFTEEQNPWKKELDDLMISFAEIIYIHSPFELGMIGWEVSGYVNHSQFSRDFLGKGIPFIIPASLISKLKLEAESIMLNNELRLFK